MNPAMTRARGIYSDQFWEFPRIEPCIPLHQEYHKWRPCSPHQVLHSIGPYPDITLCPRRERSRASSRICIQPQGDDSESRPGSTSNPEREASRPYLSPIITTPHVPNDSPISMETVANGSKYHGIPISTIKRSNLSSYEIPTRKSCR